MSPERLVQVLGVRLRDAAALALDAGRWLREFPLSLGKDGPVAPSQGLDLGLDQHLARVFAHLAGGYLEQPLHVPGPGMVVGVDDELEVAQEVGAAERVVAAFVGEIAGPAVVDQGSAVAGNDADVVHGVAASLGMAERQRQVAGAAAVQPVVLSVDADRGLVGVEDRQGEQPRRRPFLPFGQGLVQAPDPGQQVRREGDDPVSVLQRAGHRVGKGAPGLGAAVRAGLDLGVDMLRADLEDNVLQRAPLVAGAVHAGHVPAAAGALGDRRHRRLGDLADAGVVVDLRVRALALGAGLARCRLVGRGLGARQAGVPRFLARGLLHEHGQHQQAAEEHLALRADLALLAEIVEPRPEGVEFLAHRDRVHRRHHSASTAMTAASTASRSPSGIAR